jgi:hypothetical protein
MKKSLYSACKCANKIEIKSISESLEFKSLLPVEKYKIFSKLLNDKNVSDDVLKFILIEDYFGNEIYGNNLDLLRPFVTNNRISLLPILLSNNDVLNKIIGISSTQLEYEIASLDTRSVYMGVIKDILEDKNREILSLINADSNAINYNKLVKLKEYINIANTYINSLDIKEKKLDIL